MLIINLLLLALCVRTIFGAIYNKDEIHQIIVVLSELMALICMLILSPIFVKVFLTLIVLFFYQRILPVRHLSFVICDFFKDSEN